MTLQELAESGRGGLLNARRTLQDRFKASADPAEKTQINNDIDTVNALLDLDDLANLLIAASSVDKAANDLAASVDGAALSLVEQGLHRIASALSKPSIVAAIKPAVGAVLPVPAAGSSASQTAGADAPPKKAGKTPTLGKETIAPVPVASPNPSGTARTDAPPSNAGKATPPEKGTIDRKKFFDGVRAEMFHGTLNEAQVDSMSAILDEYEKRNLTDLRWLAYMFGTVYRECGSNMAPVRETFATSDAQARQRLAGAAYAKTDVITGQSYYGRGLVQLTHKGNYAVQGKRLGIDLVNNPDRALEPHLAADIMFHGMINGDFTGKKLADFFNSRSEDWFNARTIINAHDHADEVADVSRRFFAKLQGAGGG
jgi:hypothetical protein